MSHGPEHHLEHAEHAVHAAHSDFDKRVTISIAIIAAMLACVTMLGHRAHNETLQLQTLAARQSTEASDQWNYYQTKNLFNLEAQIMLDQLAVMVPADRDVSSIRARYLAHVAKYGEKLPAEKAKAEEIARKGHEYLAAAEHVHHRADRYDYGELALQLGVVLCSLAILTKGRGFWFCGIASALVGVLIALTGFLELFLAAH